MLTLGIILGLILGLLVCRSISDSKSNKDEIDTDKADERKTLSVTETQMRKLLAVLEHSINWSSDKIEYASSNEKGYSYRFSNITMISFKRDDEDDYDNYYDEDDAEIEIYPLQGSITLIGQLAQEYNHLPKNLFQISPVEYAVFRRWCKINPRYLENYSLGTYKLNALNSSSSREIYETKYAALRVWRNQQAKEEQISPKSILDDRMIGLLSEQMPANHTDLVKVLGESAKWDKYGKQILEILDGYR